MIRQTLLFIIIGVALSSCEGFQGERFHAPSSMPEGPGLFTGENGRFEYYPLEENREEVSKKTAA